LSFERRLPPGGGPRVRRFASVFLPLLLLPACVAHPLERPAPLHVRNQHPAQLTAIHGTPRAIRPVPPGQRQVAARVDWTSLWLQPGSGPDRLVTDGELLRSELELRLGIGRGVDVDIGVPLLHASSGLLDGFIEGWHEFFRLPQNGRDDAPRDEFDVGAVHRRRDGTRADAYRLEEDGIRLGDIPVFVTWFPRWVEDETGFSVGVRGGVELPTGKEEDGVGNGGLDFHLGFLAGYDGIGFSVFTWGGHSFVHHADRARDAGLDYPDIDAFGAGIELGLTERLSALTQVEWERSLLRELADSHAERDQALLWIGGRYRLGERSDIEFGVGEDLVENVSPDVTFHLGFRIGF